MSKARAIAVLCSDLHLSEKAPIARSEEADWFAVQLHALNQLRKLANELDVPILCGGDIFHKWNASAKVINFAIDHLPPMYAVPGQHDLPYHSFELINDSAFGTLLRNGTVKLLSSTKPTLIKGAWVWGFPWGTDIKPPTHYSDQTLSVAVIHAYIWTGNKKFPGAPETSHVKAYADVLKDYNVALFGDNHRGFLSQSGNCTVYNNGGFIRRNIDELSYRPRIAVLYSDGEVEVHHLECNADRFMSRDQALIEEEASHSMQKFLKLLQESDAHPLDFDQALAEYFRTYHVSKGAQRVLLEALDPK